MAYEGFVPWLSAPEIEEIKRKAAAVKAELKASPTLMRDSVLTVEKLVKSAADGRPGPIRSKPMTYIIPKIKVNATARCFY